MKLDGEYRFSNIQAWHWPRMAEEARVDPEKLIQRIDDFVSQLPDHILDTQRRMTAEGVNHPLFPRLARRLTNRAISCRRIFH